MTHPNELQMARQALADTVARFARQEIAPHVTAWDAAGEFPRGLYAKAAALGLLGLGYPEEYGGTPAPHALRLAMWVNLCRFGVSGGVLASLLSHNIGLPPVLALGSEDIRREVIPPVLAGERIAALAVTEPGGGSDVAALATRARREGDEYVVDGEKVFITSGMRADWITLAVRTGEPGERNAAGISLLLVPGDSAGLSRTRLDKMGWLCSDTAHLRFDGVRVPARYLLGEEGVGFKAIMGNFNGERFGIACGALGFAQACYDEALAWAQQRQAFGRPLVDQQVALEPFTVVMAAGYDVDDFDATVPADASDPHGLRDAEHEGRAWLSEASRGARDLAPGHLDPRRNRNTDGCANRRCRAQGRNPGRSRRQRDGRRAPDHR